MGGNTAAEAKGQVWRDIIMKRYANNKDELDAWAKNFEEDLEAYVQARIAERLAPGGQGTYGEKHTFGDARITITEIMDDFYDECDDNFNQAFLDMERKLQAYVGYERRGPEHLDEEETRDVPDTRPWPKLSFVVYNDGAVWARLAHRADAEAMVRAYNGEHNVWFEEEPEEDET